MKGEPQIYCPRCEWRPTAADRWVCSPGCGCVWNTFWTRALCPGCAHQWTDTACLACTVLSLHEDWYHYPDNEPLAEERAASTGAPTEQGA